MSTADEMRMLGESILTAQRDRAVAIAGLKAETFAYMGEVAEFTAARKAEVAGQLAELGTGTAMRRAEVAGQMAEHDTAHQAMARETREQLAQATAAMKAGTATFVGELAAGTVARRADVAGQMTGYVTEMSEAREAWREHLSPPPPKVKVAPPPKVKAAPTLPRVEVAPPPPRVEVALPPPAVEVGPDDLTVIRGIGPSLEMRLNECGVTTYAQLAGASPDMIREKLGDFGRLAKVEDWISRARELI